MMDTLVNSLVSVWKQHGLPFVRPDEHVTEHHFKHHQHQHHK
jgi:hypothetical protein